MKNFYLCNTYFQLIVSIQLHLTVFKSDQGVIVLSDHSKDMDKVAERLKSTELFEDVFYIRTKHLCGEHLETKYKLPCVIDDICGNLYGIDFKNPESYDRMVFNNDNHASLAIFAILYKYNSSISATKIEEGIGSYIINFRKDKKAILSQTIRKLLGKKLLFDATNSFYCFQPDLYPGTLQPIRIPPITPNSETVEILKKIFFESDVDYSISQKYIFFGCPYDTEGEVPIGEHELVKKIAELVGYDNLIVKAHPRDFSDDYTAMGISFYPHSSIPWEALQLTMDFSDKVFLTSVSSSVMSLNMTLENPIKTYYLFNLTRARENSSARITIDMLDKFKEKFDFNPEDYNIHIVDRLEEILE